MNFTLEPGVTTPAGTEVFVGLRCRLPVRRGRDGHVLRVGGTQARQHHHLQGQELPLKIHRSIAAFLM